MKVWYGSASLLAGAFSIAQTGSMLSDQQPTWRSPCLPIAHDSHKSRAEVEAQQCEYARPVWCWLHGSFEQASLSKHRSMGMASENTNVFPRSSWHFPMALSMPNPFICFDPWLPYLFWPAPLSLTLISSTLYRLTPGLVAFMPVTTQPSSQESGNLSGYRTPRCDVLARSWTRPWPIHSRTCTGFIGLDMMSLPILASTRLDQMLAFIRTLWTNIPMELRVSIMLLSGPHSWRCL
jgi:hypothetical protein